MLEGILEAGGFLLGRRTYEIFAAYWPSASEDQEVAEPLNSKPKHAASTTLENPLEWRNSTVLEGDLGRAVRAIMEEEGADLHVIGSTQLAFLDAASIMPSGCRDRRAGAQAEE